MTLATTGAIACAQAGRKGGWKASETDTYLAPGVGERCERPKKLMGTDAGDQRSSSGGLLRCGWWMRAWLTARAGVG